MIVICEECGKKYRIDPDKVKGDTVKFKCRSCGHISAISKPPAPKPAPEPASETATVTAATSQSAPMPEASGSQGMAAGSGAAGIDDGEKKRRFGIRAKMILLFFVLPSILSGAAALLTLQQNYRIANDVMDQSKQVMVEAGKDLVLEKAASVAAQLRLYLQNREYLSGDQFVNDPGLMAIATQKPTDSGYTLVYSEPQDGGREKAIVWVHPEGGAVGKSVEEVMKARLGAGYVTFLNLFNKALAGRRIDGSLTPGGTEEQWLAAFAPVEGTQYGVAMLTPQKGFDQPLRVIEESSRGKMTQALTLTLVIMGAAFLIIGIIVSVFGHRLTGKIQYLTSVADKISVGDLETEIEPMSGDEIGDLADAIGRMQDSLRLAIERLRRRR